MEYLRSQSLGLRPAWDAGTIQFCSPSPNPPRPSSKHFGKEKAQREQETSSLLPEKGESSGRNSETQVSLPLSHQRIITCSPPRAGKREGEGESLRG